MIESPFSPARLEEMFWREHWSFPQITTLANALLQTDEPVTVEIVRTWFEEAGVPTTRQTISLPTRPNKAPGKPQERRRPGRPGGKVTRPCAHCGAPITRYKSDFKGKSLAYCNPEHQRAHLQQQQAEKLQQRKAAGPVPDLAVTLGISPSEKRCARCEAVKEIGEFCVDVSRSDGRARICKACNKAKSQAYYAAHQEQQQARSREYKCARKAGEGA